MNIIIVCEFSGKVRDEFLKCGHNAWSCDFLPTESLYSSNNHLQGDIQMFFQTKKFGYNKWDLMIAFPPCTYLAVSGARWWKYRQKEQKEALNFIKFLLNSPIKHIALENPIGKISTVIRKSDQIIQPWQFGHGETKATCLWLKNLPLLKPTKIVEGREARIHKMPPSKDRGKLRSITYNGIAEAMAEQWGIIC